MDSNLQTELRLPRLTDALARYPRGENAREVVVNPDGGFFEAKDLPSALRRLGADRRLLLPSGSHPSADITRSIYIRGNSSAPVILQGTLVVRSSHASLTALEIHSSDPAKPALDVRSGTVILDGCTIKGGIKVAADAKLFLRSCIVSGGEEAIAATGAYVEIHTSRITGSQVGLSVKEKSEAAIYHSCIHQCVTTHESDWGAGILAKASSVYCEAATFSENGVGIYLTDCPEARVFATHFLDQQAACLISRGPDECRIHMRSCVIEGQSLNFSPQINTTGGRLELAHVTIHPADVSALAASQTSVSATDSKFTADKEIALDLQACTLSGVRVVCESRQNAGLRTQSCRGDIRDSSFTGVPPTRIETSPELTFQNCSTAEFRPEATSAPAAAAVTSTDLFIKDLIGAVSQEAVRTEMERLLRLAHASRERSLSGLPTPEQKFHSIFTGSPDAGKVIAARILAQGFYSFGTTAQPDAELIDMAELLAKNAADEPGLGVLGGGTILITMPKADFNKEIREFRRVLEKLIQLPRTVLILDGPREEMRFLIRSSHILERAFRHFLHFPDYGPIELMRLFTQLCDKDHITLQPETAEGVLMLFHTQCDRKDRRLTTTEGVEALYDAARQRYLERCSRYNRFDLPMEPLDLEIFHEKIVRFTLERNPAFASFCPHCAKENPWVFGLGDRTVCFHCGTDYDASWGLWKDSATYRRLKEIVANTPAVGPRVRRVNLSHLP